MALEDVMTLTNRLLTNADALGVREHYDGLDERERVIALAFSRVHELMRPAGELVVGVNQGDPGSLESVVDDLRSIRSGGSAIGAAEAVGLLRGAGFADVREPDLGMDIPLKLVVGTRE